MHIRQFPLIPDPWWWNPSTCRPGSQPLPSLLWWGLNYFKLQLSTVNHILIYNYSKKNGFNPPPSLFISCFSSSHSPLCQSQTFLKDSISSLVSYYKLVYSSSPIFERSAEQLDWECCVSQAFLPNLFYEWFVKSNNVGSFQGGDQQIFFRFDTIRKSTESSSRRFSKTRRLEFTNWLFELWFVHSMTILQETNKSKPLYIIYILYHEFSIVVEFSYHTELCLWYLDLEEIKIQTANQQLLLTLEHLERKHQILLSPLFVSFIYHQGMEVLLYLRRVPWS